MFNNNNETNVDDDLFVANASSSSHLAHLFGTSADLKSTLTYTPPKQPPKTTELQNLPEKQKKLVCVKTITLNRQVESTYTIVGKYGIAIIADQISADLILYKTKQNICSTTKLSTNFCYKLINELSFTFTDDQTLNWMVTFDSNKDKMDFMTELSKQGVGKQEIDEPTQFSTRLIAEKPEEEKTRADILGRMSKLGMSILPGSETPLSSPLPSLSSMSSKLSLREKELSESEPEEVIRTSKVRKFRGRHSESAIETMDLVAKPSGTPTGQFAPFAANVQHVTLGHQLMDPLNIYFAENRTHNSEVRMNLTQLSNKIDSLLLKNRSEDERDFLERRLIELERKFERSAVPQENTNELNKKLEAQIKENAQNILKYDEIITNLRNENELLLQKLETERVNAETLGTLEEEKLCLESKVIELEKLVENQKLKLNDFAEYNKQYQEEKLDRLAREAAELELKRNAEFLQVSLDQSNKKIDELEMLYQQVLESRTKEEDIFADLVKEAMNVMYQNVLTDSIDSTTNLDVRDLKKILQKHLKSTTFSIINQYSKRKDVDSSGGTQAQLASVSPEFEVTV
ncbi:uncharacterized protein [Atheta coriaria]|uniref:uncharacterized protein n=1 Tax=Dalotia coriaria TaxID=877792 RepID=UPI0031F3DF61